MLLKLLLQRLGSWLFCLAVLLKENLTSQFLQVEQMRQVFWGRSDTSGKCVCLKINDFLISSSLMEHLLLQNIYDPIFWPSLSNGMKQFLFHLWRKCYRISISLNKEAWRQPKKVQYHRSAVQHTLLFSPSFLEMRPGPSLCMCLQVNCRVDVRAAVGRRKRTMRETVLLSFPTTI